MAQSTNKPIRESPQGALKTKTKDPNMAQKAYLDKQGLGPNQCTPKTTPEFIYEEQVFRNT